jgi:hypothetical protein
MREFAIADRNADAAAEQRMADEAGARGDEWRRKFHQEAAYWMRSYRFDWEVEAAERSS